MPLESATFISQLTPTNPAAGDLKSEGDDHLRLLKSVLQNQFPSLGATAVTASAGDINATTGRAADIAAIAGAATTGAAIKVVTPATSSNDTSAASTAFTQSLVAAAVGSGSPAPAWVSGTTYAVGNVVYSPINFQTYRRKVAGAGTTDPSADSTNWTLAGGGFGTGGTTLTGNVTLTASSPAAMSVTPANPGLYVTLPDATTVSRSTAPFSVYNNGDFDYGVRDSAGTQLGWIRARTGAVIGLADNSTAAGVWAYYGLEKTGITASYVNSTLANMGSTIRRIALDANRTCFLFGGTDCYAIVYDASTQTWGAATFIASMGSPAYLFGGVLSATNQVLVVRSDSSSSNNIFAQTLTISGTGVTVNAAVSAVGAGVLASAGQLIAVGSSFVVSYGRATTTVGIRAITVSGTTPTIGAESALTTTSGGSPVFAMFASGSIVRTVYTDGTINVTAKPYTVSGSTLSVGTAATAGATAQGLRAFLNGNGRIVCHYINTTHFATIFSLSGTTETASSVSLGTVPTAILANTDYVQVTASKTLFASSNSSATRGQILTDTGGTATAGTEVSLQLDAAIVATVGLTFVGSVARICHYSSTSGGAITQINYDCSGSSPTISQVYSLTNLAANVAARPIPSDQYGVRSGGTLIAGSRAYSVGANTINVSDIAFNAATIQRIAPLQGSNIQGGLLFTGIAGAANNEGYSANYYANISGFVIQRIEAAA